MKNETLQNLLIDRELGELSPESAELLAAYLAAMPSARAEAAAMSDTVRAARTAVQRFPELAPRPALPRRWLAHPQLALAAAFALLLGAAGLFVLTRNGPPSMRPVVAQARIAQPGASTWARYDVVYDTRRAAFIVKSID